MFLIAATETQHELGRGEESLQDTHCRAFLYFFFPIQMFCLQQHVFKLTKTGIFSELLPPSHRLPCRDIAAHMFHDLTLPGATWATPTNSRLCLETAQRVGDKSAPNCQSFLSIAEGALDTFSLFSPAPHPKTPSQASNHGQVLAPPGSQTKTLPEHCSAPLLSK